ncbi:MAG: hypothetical protein J6V92_06970 [Bacteroidaceae bacterium]|nr:hypothetical protein [Bacteroidaceae bacterium]
MIYKTFRSIFLGLSLLVALSAGAQEFDSELQLSTDIIYWYRICNAAPGMDGLAMTDLNSATDGEDQEDILRLAVYMMPTEMDDYRSQWMLTAGEDGKVIITNRATGSKISNTSSIVGDHNITVLTGKGASGFTFTSLGDYAFRLESVEDDGVNRCLALADKDAGFIFYPDGEESSSAIAWKFFPVEIDTGLGSMKVGRLVVQVKNKRIYVTGCPEWELFNAAGEEMPRTVSLPTGVYLVKTAQKTVKVLVP